VWTSYLGTLHWSPKGRNFSRLISVSGVCTMEQAQGEPRAVDTAHGFPIKLTPVTIKSRNLQNFGLSNTTRVSSSVLRRGSE
jgi:hypothetical protein